MDVTFECELVMLVKVVPLLQTNTLVALIVQWILWCFWTRCVPSPCVVQILQYMWCLPLAFTVKEGFVFFFFFFKWMWLDLALIHSNICVLIIALQGNEGSQFVKEGQMLTWLLCKESKATMQLFNVSFCHISEHLDC